MAESPKPQAWTRSELLSLVSVSGTLAGLCITIVAFINTSERVRSTVVDDMLVISASAFLGCIYLIVCALRVKNPQRAARLLRLVDILFLSALSAMTFAGFVMVYSIW